MFNLGAAVGGFSSGVVDGLKDSDKRKELQQRLKTEKDATDGNALRGQVLKEMFGGSGEGVGNYSYPVSAPTGYMPQQQQGTPAQVPDRGSYSAQLVSRESGGNPNAVNPTTGAAGMYQFMPKTWQGMRQNHPELGLTENGATNPDQARRAEAVFRQENAKVLQQAGIAPTDGHLYVAHFMGAGGAVKMLNAVRQAPDAPAASLFPKEAAANKSVFFDHNGQPKSLGQLYSGLTAKFNNPQQQGGMPQQQGGMPQQQGGEGKSKDAPMTVTSIMQSIKRTNPNASPEAIAAMMDGFAPLMNTQSRQELNEAKLGLQRESLQQREQALMVREQGLYGRQEIGNQFKSQENDKKQQTQTYMQSIGLEEKAKEGEANRVNRMGITDKNNEARGNRQDKGITARSAEKEKDRDQRADIAYDKIEQGYEKMGVQARQHVERMAVLNKPQLDKNGELNEKMLGAATLKEQKEFRLQRQQNENQIIALLNNQVRAASALGMPEEDKKRIKEQTDAQIEVLKYRNAKIEQQVKERQSQGSTSTAQERNSAPQDPKISSEEMTAHVKEAQEAIKIRPDMVEKIKERFKQETGMDLPKE